MNSAPLRYAAGIIINGALTQLVILQDQDLTFARVLMNVYLKTSTTLFEISFSNNQFIFYELR